MVEDTNCYYDVSENGPLFDALEVIVGKSPPDYVKGLYSGSELGNNVLGLQDWCAENARPSWSTGLGILEAAELMVREAVANANIPPARKIKQ